MKPRDSSNALESVATMVSPVRSQTLRNAGTLCVPTNWPSAVGYRGASGSAGAVQAAAAPELRGGKAVLHC